MSCILIVEDQPIDAALLRKYAEEIEGYTVQTVGTLADARLTSLREHPALVVLDYHLPDGHAISFLGEFRALAGMGDTPVLALSADDAVGIRRTMLEAGANDFIIKPVDRVEFKTRALNLLELRASRLALSDRAEWLMHEVQLATKAIRLRERETVYRLARAAEFRDSETGAHLVRMAHYCELLARTVGESDAMCETIFLAAPMHDIGKVATPDSILLKPGRHTTDEFAIMKAHARDGYDILRDSESALLRMAADIALTHHERFDGRGYPLGVRGVAIPLSGRIVALADVFDALTSKRVYKEAWSVDRACAEIDGGRGTHFDPYLVDAFYDVLPEILRIRELYADTRAVPESDAV